MRILATLTVLLMLAGCPATVGIKPETVNQSFLMAFSLVQSANESVVIAIQDPSVGLSRASAQSLRDHIERTRLSLDTAYEAFQLGQQFDQEVFQNTRVLLETVRAVLMAAGATPTGTTSYEPVGDFA